MRPASATRRCAACSKKRTDALAAGAAELSAGAAGGGLRDPEGSSAGPLPPALRYALSGDLQGRTAQTAAGRPAAAATGAAPAPSGCSWNRWTHGARPWTGRTRSRWDHPRDRQAERLIRVCDPLNTHAYASLSGRFRPPRRTAWPGAYSGCLRPGTAAGSTGRTGTERPDAPSSVPAQVTAWAEARNAAQKGIDWQFRTADARMRLKHLYPTI